MGVCRRLLSADRETGCKSLFAAGFSAYPQNLWKSLWTRRGRGAPKRMASPFPTLWTRFGHEGKLFKINNVKNAAGKYSLDGHVPQSDLTGY
jgi:hypothetical protein